MISRGEYLAACRFLSSRGGAFAVMDGSTCENLIDGMVNGRCRIVVDGRGEIVRVSVWWRIWPEDLETVRQGGRPEERATGPVLYVAEHGGPAGPRLFYRELERIEAESGRVTAVCWHSRYNRPDTFRYHELRRVA